MRNPFRPIVFEKKEIRTDEISAQIIRSRRRTISLEVLSDATVILRSPKNTSESYLQKILRERKSWIQKKQKKFQTRFPTLPKRRWEAGETIFFQGDLLTLCINIGKKPSAKYEEAIKTLHLTLRTHHDAERVCTQWLKKQAKEILTQRAQFFAQKFSVLYQDLRITSAKSRWGSCCRKKNINFAWRLIMTPPDVIDYVIIHELAHLRNLNHSARFWELVSHWMPDYKTHKKWLQENGWKCVL